MSIPIKPMLAKKGIILKEIPDEHNYMFETKWDGMRVIVDNRDQDNVRLWTRRGLEVTEKFPELLDGRNTFHMRGVYDGEICCFDKNGKSNFRTVVGRRHLKGTKKIKRRSEQDPATVMLFDVLELMGRSYVDDTWDLRHRRLLTRVLEKGYSQPFYRISKTYRDWKQLWDDTIRMGLEGIMVKDIDAPYYPGKRRRAWLKVKVLHVEDVLVTGFTVGEGKRKGYFGSLKISDPEGNSLGYVGTGFTDDELREYMEMFLDIGAQGAGKEFQLLRPIPAEVRHMERTVHGALREPVFMRFRTED